MKEYFRLLKLLKPYKGFLVLSFILVILYSFFNAASIYLSIPLLKTLFTQSSPDIGLLPTQTQNFFDRFRVYIDSYIFGGGDKYASLVRVCILLLSAYFLKNIFEYFQLI